MSLGITEYPWSSDDDLEESAAPAASQESTAHRPAVPDNSTNDAPGTSASRFQEQRQQQPTASRRSQDRADRELFWSYINGPCRFASTNSLPVGQQSGEGGYQSRVRHTPAPELQERAPGADYRRLLVLRNLSRRMARQGRYYSQLGRVPASRRSVQSAPAPRATSSPVLAPIDEDEINNNPPQSLPHALSDEEMLDVPDTIDPEEANETVAVADVREVAEGGADAGADADTTGSVVVLDEPDERRDHADVADAPAATAPAAQNSAGQNAEVVLATSETNTVPRVPRKRRLPSREHLSVKEFNLSLLRLLECPVCLEWMEPPMWQCRRGHIVCGGCRARLTACPVCRTGFSSVRNRAMEGVAELVRYPCRHGCAREVSLRRRGAHEASCRARKYACPAPACADKPPLPHDALTQHFQTKHQSMLKLGCSHSFSMKMNAECRAEWLVRALDQYFHLRIDVDRVCGLLARVCYIGPLCDAANYTYEVSMESAQHSRRLTYARVTHSDVERTSSGARHDCFHLTFEQALHFMRAPPRHHDDRLVDFTVTLAATHRNAAQHDSDS